MLPKGMGQKAEDVLAHQESIRSACIERPPEVAPELLR